MSSKQLLRIGLLTFLCMGVMALVFYKERTTFLDTSFHLFSILKDNSFAIQNNRFAAFFTQLFPLYGSRIGLSLAVLARLYSLAFVLLPAITFATILAGCKNIRVAMAYLLYLVLMTTHVFYWIQSEMPQGAAFMFLFAALLDNALKSDRFSPAFLFAAPVLLFTLAFAHPLLLFPFAYLMFFLRQQYGTHKQALLALLGAGLAFFFVKSIFMGNYYDAEKMSGIDNIRKFFPDYFSMKANGKLLRYLLRDYYFVPVGLGLCLYFYGTTQQWRRAALLVAFFLGYAFLINVSNPEGGDQFYFENFYLNLALIVALPLAFDALPALLRPPLQTAVLATVCAVCLLRIWATHDGYSARVQWHRDRIREVAASPHPKWIITPWAWPKDTVIQSWGSPYESWLLSTIETGRSSSFIIEENEGEFNWAMPKTRSWITRWGVFDYNTLNPRYFRFTDTSSFYLRPR